MANAPSLSNTAANAAANGVTALCNSGYLRIYDGTKPASADTAITTQTLLAELTFGSTSFSAASGATATANAITADSSANASGTATWFRVVKSDGTTVVFDGTVGTSGADLNLNSTSISAGASVSVTSFTYTQSKA